MGDIRASAGQPRSGSCPAQCSCSHVTVTTTSASGNLTACFPLNALSSFSFPSTSSVRTRWESGPGGMSPSRLGVFGLGQVHSIFPSWAQRRGKAMRRKGRIRGRRNPSVIGRVMRDISFFVTDVRIVSCPDPGLLQPQTFAYTIHITFDRLALFPTCSILQIRVPLINLDAPLRDKCPHPR